MSKQAPRELKQNKEFKVAAEEVTQRIAEKFSKMFSEKIGEMTEDFHAHLDDHMDEIEEMMAEGFSSIHEHIGALERLEKLEKKMQQIESNGKRFIT